MKRVDNQLQTSQARAIQAKSMRQATQNATRFAENSDTKSRLNAKPREASTSPSSTGGGAITRIAKIVSKRLSVNRQTDKRFGDSTVLMSRPSEHVWVRNDKDVWQLVRKVATSKTGDAVEVEVKGEKLRVSFKNTLPFEPEHLENWDDVFQMPSLNEAALLGLIKRRWAEGNIYTRIGEVLISVNPYYNIKGLYDMPKTGETLPVDTPHLYTVAENAYQAMITGFKSSASQSILINGESGSGKTEATKKIMAYLAEVSQRKRKALDLKNGRVISARLKGFVKPNLFNKRGAKKKATSAAPPALKAKSKDSNERLVSAMEESIMQANIVLECLGNAKTVTNDNSSRFGKFVQLEYDAATQTICSAVTRHFLLEKTRITTHAAGGRNYHLFYQLCAAFGAKSDELDSFRDAGFTLLPAHEYKYLVGETEVDEDALAEQDELREEEEYEQQQATADAQAEANARAEEERKRTAPTRHDRQGCNEYRLDMTGKSYGDCVCGAPRRMHGAKAIKDAGTLELKRQEEERLKQEAQERQHAQQVIESAKSACDNYKLDMRGVSYGDCTCGHSRKDHLDKNKDNRLKFHGKGGRTLERNASRQQHTMGEGGPPMKRDKACRVYRLDVAAEDGECVCGHSRSAHARQGGRRRRSKPRKQGKMSAAVGTRLASIRPPSKEELEFDAQMFDSTVNALDSVLIDNEERTAMFRVVAAVLELGNINFRKSKTGKTKVDTTDPKVESSLRRLVKLLEVSDVAKLEKAFSTRTVRAGKRESVSVIELSVEQANEARDGLAKTLYSSLFEWVVRRVNIATRIAIPSKDAPDPALQSKLKPFIGILDIFGYEVLQDNSFEQLCIAFANQSLQHIFDRHWEAQEKKEYIREGVSHAKVAFRDNQALLNLLDKPPNGIFQLLDEQILLGSKATDEAFLLKVNMVHGTAIAGDGVSTAAVGKAKGGRRGKTPPPPPALSSSGRPVSMLFTGMKFADDNEFTIRHYAGRVTYNVKGFVKKNTNATQPDLEAVLAQGDGPSQSFIREILDARDRSAAAASASAAARSKAAGDTLGRKSGARGNGSVSGKSGTGGGGGRRKSSTKPDNTEGGDQQLQPRGAGSSLGGGKRMANLQSVSLRFRYDMHDLEDLLNSTALHFVRCVNPNAQKAPDYIDGSMVVDQLRMLGVLEMVRVRHEGFPVRMSFDRFMGRYRMLVPDESVHGARAQSASVMRDVFGQDAKGSMFQLGETKCFLRNDALRVLDMALQRAQEAELVF